MLFTIPGHLPFVDVLAAGIVEKYTNEKAGGDGNLSALARVTVYLPTRRACRALSDAFLRGSNGAPMLLPKMLPIGDLDEEEQDFSSYDGVPGDAIDLPPQMPDMARRLILTRLILKLEETQGTGRSVGQAAQLAGELIRLLDQVQSEGVPFSRLSELVPDEFADHWQITLKFLEIITRAWPKLVEEKGYIEPVDRRNILTRAQADLWRSSPPTGPIIAAGTTGSIPATAELLTVIASLANGAVILPGLDQGMDADSWAALSPTHPQYGMARLLDKMETDRQAVGQWPLGVLSGVQEALAVTPARLEIINESLRPCDATGDWATFSPGSTDALAGVRQVACPAPREEAGVIALLMRECLETPAKRAALVTPDRALARRVAAELKRWDVEVDDSAGLPLSLTPPGVFVRLVADAAITQFSPVALLSTLKHPMAALGRSLGGGRATVRLLERFALRGPRPAPGIDGLVAALKASKRIKEDDRKKGLAFLDDLESCTAPFAQCLSTSSSLKEIVRAHLSLCQALAQTDDMDGAQRLWSGDAGEDLAGFFSRLLEDCDELGDLDGRDYPALLEALMEGAVHRPRYGRHPRLFIWGPLEARLQQADLMILGGLNEGTWPGDAHSDPWMSRPMRERFGLPLPERRIGLSAHDFVGGFASPQVVLTRSTRVDGAPSVASRWWLRLETLMAAHGGVRSGADHLALFEAMDIPSQVKAASPPRPTPPICARPAQLSVTQVETWIRDPYAIYARKILRLEALEDIDADPGAPQRGLFIHQALEHFIEETGKSLPENAEARLLALGEEAFGGALDSPAVRAFWWPRFIRIARWFVNFERRRREEGHFPAVTEAQGEITLPRPGGGDFTLTARADRMDVLGSGELAILDYKTGAPPTKEQVNSGLSPQLPLEAAMVLAGGFANVSIRNVAALSYIHLGGGDPPGRFAPVKPDDNDLAALIEKTKAGLIERIAQYDNPDMPYLSRPHPVFKAHFGDYDHLARVKEWSAGLDEDGDG